jgi:endonuclease/exonuclease/phosphatase (EEP) superfamily protein YafD
MFLKKAIGFAYFLSVSGLMLMAVAAAFGFAHPSLDSFNHLQPFIFSGTLLGLVLMPFLLQQTRWQTFIVSICATGFVASSLVVIPEMVSAWRPKQPLPTDGRQVYKLMTQNVFGQNWEMGRMHQAIMAENPDILTFQEYFSYQSAGLHPNLLRDYPYFAVCRGGKRENIAIYSRFPFVAEKGGACAQEPDEKRVSRVFGSFEGEDGVGFTIATTHLDWPAQISQLRQGTDIWDGLDRSIARQRDQFAQLSEALNVVSGPLILTADFNSTSWSYGLRNFAFRSGLTRQDRMILTYPMRFYIAGWRDTIPFLPLDHVMTRGGIDVHAVYAGDPAGSDHRPIITLFSVNR